MASVYCSVATPGENDPNGRDLLLLPRTPESFLVSDACHFYVIVNFSVDAWVLPWLVLRCVPSLSFHICIIDDQEGEVRLCDVFPPLVGHKAG